MLRNTLHKKFMYKRSNEYRYELNRKINQNFRKKFQLKGKTLSSDNCND